MTDQAKALAQHVRWSRTVDRTAATAAARRAFEQKFVDEARAAHPEATDEQVAAMAASARKAFHIRNSRKAVKARAALRAERRAS